MLDDQVVPSSTLVHPYLADVPFIAMAHRGGGKENAENSLTAFAHAVELGFTFIETDVRVTRDGVVVIHHDETLDRTTDGHGRVRDRSWQSVSRMVQDSGDHPMRLTDALEEFPDTRFNVDCKDDATVQSLVATLERLGPDYFPRLCIASFSDQRVAAIQRHFGRAIATSAGRREVTAWIRSSYGLRRVVRTRAIAAQVPVSTLGFRVITPRFMQTAANLGCHVHAWTVDDTAEMAKLVDMGVHGIITDRPTVLRDFLVERGLWSQPQA